MFLLWKKCQLDEEKDRNKDKHGKAHHRERRKQFQNFAFLNLCLLEIVWVSHPLELKEKASFKSFLQPLTQSSEKQLEIGLQNVGGHLGWRAEHSLVVAVGGE